MNDSDILQHIHALVAEEKELRAAHAGNGLRQEQRSRLASLEEQLDQAWDLLRQRSRAALARLRATCSNRVDQLPAQSSRTLGPTSPTRMRSSLVTRIVTSGLV